MKKKVTWFGILLILMFLNINIVKAGFPDTITGLQSSSTSYKYNGYDYLPFKTCKVSGNSRAAFCTRFSKSVPSGKCSRDTSKNKWSYPISAGVAAIIEKYNQSKATQTKRYYYAELAINRFLYNYDGSKPSQRISSTRNNDKILKDYVYWYNNAVSVYKNVSDKFNLAFSANKLTFKRISTTPLKYRSNAVTAKDKNTYFKSIAKEKCTCGSDCTCNIKISGNKFQVFATINRKDKKAHTYTVKASVKGKRIYKIASEYKCSTDDSNQRLTPNYVQEHTQTTTKTISGKIKVAAVKYSLTIQKRDESTHKGLKGAKFNVYKKSNCTGNTVYKGLTSNSNGYTKTVKLSYGNYYVKEVSAPAGYNSNTKCYIADLNKGNQTVTVDNSKKTYPFKIFKYTVNSNGSKVGLGKATFLLFKESNCTGSSQTLTSAANGYTPSVQLTNGNYSVKEKDPPDGYNKISTCRNFVIASKEKTLEIKNTKKDDSNCEGRLSALGANPNPVDLEKLYDAVKEGTIILGTPGACGSNNECTALIDPLASNYPSCESKDLTCEGRLSALGANPNPSDLSNLYDAVKNGTVSLETPGACGSNNECTALTDERASNYPSCGIAKRTCTDDLLEILEQYPDIYDIVDGEAILKGQGTSDESEEYDNENESEEIDDEDESEEFVDEDESLKRDSNFQDVKKKLDDLQSRYPKYTNLSNYSSPSCDNPTPKNQLSCSGMNIVSDEFTINIENAVCKIKYNLHSSIMDNQIVRAGSLLWSPFHKTVMFGYVDYDCSGYKLSNIHNSFKVKVDDILPQISIRYVDESTNKDTEKNINLDRFIYNTTRNVNANDAVNYNDTIAGYIGYYQAGMANALFDDLGEIQQEYLNDNILDFNDDGKVNINDALYYQMFGFNLTQDGSELITNLNNLKGRAIVAYNYPHSIKSLIGSGEITNNCDEDTNCMDIGYGVPIGFNVASGTYTQSGLDIIFPKQVKISSLNIDPSDNNSYSLKCPYEVINQTNKDYSFRPISSSYPFGNATKHRFTGSNWCYNNNNKPEASDSSLDGEDTSLSVDYDTNETISVVTQDKVVDNRCSYNNKTVETYIKNRPDSSSTEQYLMYSFTLTPSNLKSIRKYNKSNQYADYKNISCKKELDDETGAYNYNCLSSFVTNLFKGINAAYSSGYCKGNRNKLCSTKELTS